VAEYHEELAKVEHVDERGSSAVEWVNVILESPRSFLAVLISLEGADQESG